MPKMYEVCINVGRRERVLDWPFLAATIYLYAWVKFNKEGTFGNR